MKYKQIKSLSALKKAATSKDGNYAEFFISFGIARSSKSIRYFPGKKSFNVNNDIDGTSQEGLTEKQLKSKTLIYDAIRKGCFYQDLRW